MTELNSESLNSRLDHTERRISALEERSFKIIQSEEQRERRMKRNEESLWDLDIPLRKIIYVSLESQKEKRGKRGQKVYK